MEIVNCTWPHRDAQCPRFFCTRLRQTDDSNVGVCESCLERVFLCRSEEEAAARKQRGERVAKGYLLPGEVIVGTYIRFYTIQRDQGHFEVGMADERQVLIGNTVHDIIVHWFDGFGRFIRIERFHMGVNPPTFPGKAIYQTGSDYQRQVDEEIEALKTRLGFRAADIRVMKFASGVANIADLPAEYMDYLDAPDSHDAEDRAFFEEAIRQWRTGSNFVLSWCGEYWFSGTGEVIAH